MRRRPSFLVNLTALTVLCVGGGQVKAQPQQPSPEPTANPPAGPRVLPRQVLPLAPQVKGNRPKSNPAVLPPAATTLPPETKDLLAPEPLALPVRPSQVQIRELRPLGLEEVETLVEVNNPS
ncbi:MAG TPA: hypothetical protein VER57_04055, partial [Cyanobium sp.]|nr:hypothetical protein [Cyanobium sp.]